MNKLLTIEFLSETKIEFSGRYPSKFFSSSEHLLLPIPNLGKIIYLDCHLKIITSSYFKGDQTRPKPFHFRSPTSIVAVTNGGYLVCDKEFSKLIFFDESGHFQYGRTPPGVLEHNFVKPIDIAVEGNKIAVIEKNDRLSIINNRGKLQFFFLNGMNSLLQTKIPSITWYRGIIYLLRKNLDIVSISPFYGEQRSFSVSTAAKIGKLLFFCFDSEGTLFLVTSHPSLLVLNSETNELLAKYENYGYSEGDLRYPHSISVDNNGFIYVLDDNRVMKFRMALNLNEKD